MMISSAILSFSSGIITFPLCCRNFSPANLSVRLPLSTTTLWFSSSTLKKPVLVACLKQKQKNVQEQENTKEKAETIEDKSLTAEIKRKLSDVLSITMAFTVFFSLVQLIIDCFSPFLAVCCFLWNFLAEMKPHYKEYEWMIDAIMSFLDAIKKFFEIWNYVESYLDKKKDAKKTAEYVEEEKKKTESVEKN